MAKSLLVFSVLFLAVVASVIAAPTPKKQISFNVCKKNDPNIDKCLRTAVQNVIPDLGEGYPKLRIPAIEPFELPSLEIDHGKGSSKSVSIDLKMKDVKINGLTSTVIDSLKTDLDNYRLSGKISFTKPLEITGHYTVNGKVLVLPITGSGPCTIVLHDPKLDLKEVVATPYEKNGKTYVQVKKIDLKLTSVKKLNVKLENLFNGNKQLGESMNSILNENWSVLLEELQPAFEEAVAAIAQDIVNKALQKTAYSDIFPQ
ncbi:circadian clock-controlled protein daywake-like [Adelges cooleyi]|uniref:circadian clock-controlled protein daywake-like n=1 Tax=Adelges cooleyi TaxID=133065 RepID=UPI00217FAEEF|nr:circadian clock-controlled protein daywake-like [Adelges cooleyi]